MNARLQLSATTLTARASIPEVCSSPGVLRRPLTRPLAGNARTERRKQQRTRTRAPPNAAELAAFLPREDSMRPPERCERARGFAGLRAGPQQIAAGFAAAACAPTGVCARRTRERGRECERRGRARTRGR